MRKILLLMGFIACLCLPAKSFGQLLTDFYKYQDGKVTLNDNFKAQLNKAEGGILTSNSYTWKTGDPLPNPVSDGNAVTDMSDLFSNCSALTSLDLSKFNTSNVTDMSHMFQGCSGLTSLDLSNFNTSKVTNMSYMFSECSELKSLDLLKFDTSKVTSMNKMFFNCGKADGIVPAMGWILDSDIADKFNKNINTDIDATRLVFSTPNLADFYEYTLWSNGYKVSLSNAFKTALSTGSFIDSKGYIWETGKPLPNPAPNGMYNGMSVNNMNSMFMNCAGLTNLDLSSFDTSNVTSISYMFFGCSGLTNLDLSSFDTSNVTTMSQMFYGCSGLTSLDLSNFNTSNVTTMSQIFYGCSGLTSLDLLKFDISKVIDMSQMFYGCSGLTSLDLSNFNTSNVTDMSQMFSMCSRLTSLDLSKFDTFNITTMRYMFQGCSGLMSLDISKFDTSKVTYMNSMFSECSGLTSLDISKFDTSNVISMNDMFDSCSGLTSLDLSNFNTSKVTNMRYMFSKCSGMKSLDISNFDTSKVTDMSHMFYGCSGLTKFDLSSFDTSKVTKMIEMFYNCGNTDGSGQATIGITKDWDTAYKFNDNSNIAIDNSKLKFGVANKYNNLDYVIFQDYDGSNKSATLVASKTDNYAGTVAIASNVEVGTDKFPVTAVAPMAFKNCSDLSGVELPMSIAKVGDYAFVGTPASISLNMLAGTPPAVTGLAFDDAHYASAILTVPGAAKTAYNAHEVWSKFTNMPSGIDSANKDNSDIYVARIPNGVVVSGIEAGETVKLYSGEGALMRSVNASESSVTIDGVQSGMYIVNVGAKAVKVVI